MAESVPNIALARPVAVLAVRPWVVNALIAAALTILFAGPLLMIPRHIPLTYNEGWNAYFTVRAMLPAVGPLYPPADALVSNNYPPLSFFIVGAVARLVGDPIVAGRLVALAALLASAGLVAIVVRQLGGGRRWAGIAGLSFLLYAAACFPQYVAMDDPQWLAQAVMLAGLAVLLEGGASGPRRPAAAIGAALLMAAALLVKHNLLGQPAAVAAWLLLNDRRGTAIWGAAFVAALAASLAAIGAHHGDFAADVFHHARLFSTNKLLWTLPSLLLFVPLCIVAARLVRERRDPAALFALLFAVAAFGCGVAQRGGEGVSYNAQFEGLAALTIAAALAVSHLDGRQGMRDPRRVGRTMFAIALPLLIMTPVVAWREAMSVATLTVRETAWQRAEMRIAATPGPVACELLAQCFWAGKPFEWDFFNTAERLRSGGNVAPLAARIARHDFAAIVLTRRPGFAASDTERLPQPLPALIERTYTPVLSAPDGVAMMVPR